MAQRKAWHYFSLVFVASYVFAAPDSQGKEFILGFMENRPLTTDIELFITTVSTVPVTVNITLPKFKPNWSETITVTGGNVEKVNLPMDIRGESIEKSNKGVLIQASDEISVCSINKEPKSADAYISLPVDVLSTEYYAVTYTKDAQFMVIATEDDTDVTIKWPLNAAQVKIEYGDVTYRNGDTLRVTLDKFETFHVSKTQSSADYTGVHITSSKPVAVVSGNRKVSVPVESGTSDHLTEMLMPVDTWGKTFMTTSTPDRTIGDIYRIVASEDATTVSLYNGTSYIVSKAGDFLELDIPTGDYQHITSDKPVMMVMFAKTFQNDGPNNGDPAMSIVIPETQYAADYTWSSVQDPTGQEFNNKVAVVIDKSQVGGVRLDGDAVSWKEEKKIKGSDVKVHLWTRVTPGSHNLHHIDPTVTFLALVSGTFKVNSYAYSAGLRLAKINAPCEPSSPVPGDIVDNDCDGLVDEETLNGIDDDGDGKIDEDLAAAPREDDILTESAGANITETSGSSTDSNQLDTTTDSTTENPDNTTTNSENPDNTTTHSENSDTRATTAHPENPDDSSSTTDSLQNTTQDATNPEDSTQDTQNPETDADNYQDTKLNIELDGSWTTWGDWGKCNGTCGEVTGVRYRYRNCTHPAYSLPDDLRGLSSAGCDGVALESEKCTPPPCPETSDLTEDGKNAAIIAGGAVFGLVVLGAIGVACCCQLYPCLRKKIVDDDEEKEERRISEREMEDTEGYGTLRNAF
ncbi:IgGFc-binding protein-like [Littorina saxatilis]|uniref:IgGFc-binding protein-like n=1 Tax=Littorina saxatilis TaxID=31220 RepID=UPI0038B543E3